VVIPYEVLAKPGRLSPEEWSLMQSHPIEGV
jgi:HD-GYP domain-containing protein (c-di-GMP phosphodiesterase class II)